MRGPRNLALRETSDIVLILKVAKGLVFRYLSGDVCAFWCFDVGRRRCSPRRWVTDPEQRHRRPTAAHEWRAHPGTPDTLAETCTSQTFNSTTTRKTGHPNPAEFSSMSHFNFAGPNRKHDYETRIPE